MLSTNYIIDISPKYLKDLFFKGINIIRFLKEKYAKTVNLPEFIEMAYDIQAGYYILRYESEDNYRHIKDQYNKELATIINSLLNPSTILEAGIGDGTTINGVISNLNKKCVNAYGFDLSWSRAAYAQKWLNKNGNSASICLGDLLYIPFADNSIDVVYTSHSIEPNRGKEREILIELYRVARKYVILVEPIYELASQEAKERMDFHGYCKNLYNYCIELEFKVIEYKLYPYIVNSLNPTGVIIIEKTDKLTNSRQDKNGCYPFVDPIFKTPLKKIKDGYFSEESLKIYPEIGTIPCLIPKYGVLASKYMELNNRIK